MSRDRGPKQPRTAFAPPGEKRPVAGPVPDYDRMSPAWRISAARRTGRFSFGRCTGEDYRRLRDRMSSWETMTWFEIERGRSNGFIPPEHVTTEAQALLRDLHLDLRAQDSLYHLRLDGATRIWGFREGRVFTLLWWDPGHEVCPSRR